MGSMREFARGRGRERAQLRRSPLLAVAVSVAAIAVVGCGSSTTTTSDTSAADTATTGAADTTSTAAAAPTSTTSSAAPKPGPNSAAQADGTNATAITDFAKYTESKGGKADSSLPPVYIGWVNQEGGQQEIGPLATAGADLAVKYINEELGGVDGHPVALKKCFIRSAEEEGTTCAQQLLADKSVNVVDMGAVGIGVQSFYSTLAGAKPVILGVAVGTVDSVQKNAFIYYGDGNHITPSIASYAKDTLGAKSASVAYANTTGIGPSSKATISALEAKGIATKDVAYDETSPDVIGALTRAGASSADAFVPLTSAAGCVNMAKGLQQLGVKDPKKIVSNPLCLSGDVMKGLGDFPQWTYGSAVSFYSDLSDPAEVAFHKVTAKYVGDDANPDPWFQAGFAEVLTTTRFLNQLGYGQATPAKVQEKAKAFVGPVALGAPNVDCGKYPAAPAVCNDQMKFYTYEGKGKFVKASGFLQAP